MNDHVSGPVPCIKRGSVFEFRARSRNGTRPLVIDNATAEWKAAGLWNVDYLRARLGAQPVRVAISRDGVFRGDPRLGFSHLATEMRFDEFLDIVSSPPQSRERCCLHQMPLQGPFAALLDDIVRPPYIDPSLTARPHLWIGAAGYVTSLHYDRAANLLTQVTGRKRLLLFSPDQTEFLYPFDRSSKIPHMSQVDVNCPDLGCFPKYRHAHPTELVLQEGQMLFLPRLWWHHVTSLDSTISVNFWWDA